MTRTVLLTGADGQLGRALRRALAGRDRVVATTRATLDVRDADALRRTVRTLRPTVIVNAAAWTAVDAAEDHRDDAWAVNAAAPGILAEEAMRADAALVHYSTDYVFDGEATRPYDEAAPTRPLGAYGASKRAGEEAVARAGARALVLRTSWLFAAHGHGFLQTMLRLATSDRREPVRVVNDRRGTPTSARFVADATATILASARLRDANDDVWGTYHVTAAGETTWYGFAEAIFAAVAEKGHAVPPLVPISSVEYPTRAARPAYSVLDTSRVARTFGVQTTPWEAQLRAVLDEQLDGAGADEPLLVHRD